MKATLILSTLLLTMQEMSHSKYLTPINRILQDVLHSAKALDVQFIIQDLIESKCEIVDEIYRSVSRTVPTSCISFNESIPTKLPAFRAYDSTLIVYVYVSKSSPDRRAIEDIIRVIVYDDTRPRVLLIAIPVEQNNNFELLLKQMWQNRILHAIILELSESNGQMTGMRIHQYDPFRNIYELQTYTPSIQWFPDKLMNFHGYPVTVHVTNRLGYMNVTTNSKGYLVSMSDIDADVLQTLAESLNFTIVARYIKRKIGITRAGMEYGSAEMLMTTFPMIGSHQRRKLKFTLPINFEKWCPLVPIIRKYDQYVSRAFIGIAFNCIIVILVWFASIILKFNSRQWNPLNIFGLIISASVLIKPKSITERIIFFIIIVISSIYSSHLYRDVTSASLRVTDEIEYTSFDELYDSGLIPVVKTALFNDTFEVDDESFVRLKEKAIDMPSSRECANYLAKYRNVTCLTEWKHAKIMINMHIRNGEPIMKICKNLCYTSPPSTYYFFKHSPYVNRVTDVILRVEEAGIREIWYNNNFRKVVSKKRHFMDIENTQKYSLVFNIIYITGWGYLISVLVFFLELIVRFYKK
ncbi:uncharacterized protein LOC128873383 [Hylaeus volcanicus]|uniref:uncharacterized protein LOC128873383 n=1 Tax=Hylaeus volcanicus TaxID=313075 RepID=UPI0023B8685A|nr:uncharacterized protein LOC128873383 [Hylaeus volcanicus]